MDQRVLDQLASNPEFQAASKEEQVRMAMDALSQPEPEMSDEQRAIPNGERPSPLSFGGAAATVGEGLVQAAGGAAGRKAVAKVLEAQPHPVGKAIGIGLEFLGGVSGSAASGAGAGAARAELTGEDVTSAAARGAGEGAVGELGGRVLESGFKAASKLITGNKLAPGAAKDVANAQEHGVQLRPAEVSETSPSAMLEQLTRRSLVAGNKFTELDAKNSQAVRGWVEQLAKEHFDGLQSPAAVGQAVQDVLKGESIPALKAHQRSMYDVLDKMKAVKPVESQALLNKLLELKSQINPRIAPQANNIIDSALETISQVDKAGKRIPKGISFSEMHDLRSVLNQVGRDHTEVLSDRVGGIAKNIANGPLLDAMEAAARRSGPDVYTRWKAADTFTKEMHGLLDNAAISQAMKKSPEDVVAATFRGNQVTETKKLLNALTASSNPGQAVRAYRSGAMNQLLEKSMVDGAFSPERLVAETKKYSPELLEATFGKKFMTQFDDLISVAKRINRSRKQSVAGNASETARGTQNLAEVAALGSAATGAMMGAPGALIGLGAVTLSVNQLSRVMNSPKGIDMLKRGLVVKPGTAEAAKLVPQIMAVALGETVLPE